MPDNLVGTLLTSLVRAAAVTVVGPAGLVVAPALATVCIWAGEQLGEGARPFAESLTHVFGHLAGDKAKEAFSSLRETGNHDLERMAAVAFRAALDAIHIRIESAGGLLTADFPCRRGRSGCHRNRRRREMVASVSSGSSALGRRAAGIQKRPLRIGQSPPGS